MFGHASPPRVRESFALFEDMRLAGFKPNGVTCNVLLDACARGKEVLCALKIYGYMKENNVKTDEMTFCAMSRVYMNVHMFGEAEEMLNLMARSGLNPSVVSYVTMMERMRKAGKNAEVIELFDRLCEHGTVQMNKSIAKQVMKAASFATKNKTKLVKRLHAQMAALDIALDREQVKKITGVSLPEAIERKFYRAPR